MLAHQPARRAVTRWLSFAQWACLVLLLAGAANVSRADSQDSRTEGLVIHSTESAGPDRGARDGSLTGSVREHCPGVQKAVGFYRRKYTASRERMNLEGAPPREWYPCAAAKRRAKVWRARAHVAALELAQYRTYQYAWRTWMPRGWQNIGACETGYGRRPGNFQHNSGAYQGAFGFAVSSWDGFAGSADPKAGPYPSEAYLATPRQQYEVALAIYRRFGLSGWGCRGAYYR